MTIAEKIKAANDAQYAAPLNAWNVFVALGEVINTSAGEIIKEYNTTERYLYFILKGCGGLLLWNKNNFVCTDIYFEGKFFGDYTGFLDERKTAFEVITFEPSELFRISRSNFDHLGYNTVSGTNICRFSAEGMLRDKQNQQVDILTKSASQRYAEMQINMPDIDGRIPQKYIASYLGITPQSLSRIRKQQ